MVDELGDRMKLYEGATSFSMMPLVPVMARLDGKAFSSWTHDLNRPYDERLSKLMLEVTKQLVVETCAVVGYTQSDEISLVFHSDTFKSQIFMGGKHSKIVSILASMCTAFFNAMAVNIDAMPNKLAFFDCRVWQVPNKIEACNTLLWREIDASKNSVQMAARHYFSHKQLDKLGRSDQIELLHSAGVDWNKYPVFFKRGQWIRRKKVYSKIAPEELANLPEKHTARQNPDMVIERAVVDIMDMPIFSKVTNREAVVFHGAEPIEACGARARADANEEA